MPNPYVTALQSRNEQSNFNFSTTEDYSFDDLLKDRDLLDAVYRYANNVEDRTFNDDQEAVDWFINDRRWKDSNTLSTLKELNFVKGGFGATKASVQDLKDLRTIRERWETLPGAFSRIGEGDISGGLEAIGSNIAKGFVDPTILFGGVFGKIGGRLAGQGAKQLTKNVVSTSVGVTTDALLGAGAEAGYQQVNVEVGLQDNIDGWSALTAGGINGLLSLPGHYVSTRAKPASKINDPYLAAQQARKGSERLSASGVFTKDQGLYDTSNFDVPGPDGKPVSISRDKVLEGKQRFEGVEAESEARMSNIQSDIESVIPETKYFSLSPSNISDAVNPKSRTTMSTMSPDDFLSLARQDDLDVGNINKYRKLIREGVKFDTLPELVIKAGDQEGLHTVISHEGRHRAAALKAEGIDKMPVKITSEPGRKGGSIRWDETNTRPTEIMAEQGAEDINFKRVWDDDMESDRNVLMSALRGEFQGAPEGPSLADNIVEFTNVANVSPEQLKNGKYLNKVFKNINSLYGSKFYNDYVAISENTDKLMQDLFFVTDEDKFMELLNGRVEIIKDKLTDHRPALLKGRGVIPDRLAEKRAKGSLKGQTLEESTEAILDTPTGFVDTVEGSMARQMVLARLEKEYLTLTEKVALGKNLTVDEARRFDWISTAYPAADMAFSEMKSEAGRTLRSFQARYAPTTQGIAFKKANKLVNPLTNKEVSPEEYIKVQQDIAKAIMSLEPGDALALDLFHMNLHKAEGSDMLWEAWYNGLLSSPSTFIINAIGNTTTGMMAAYENAFASVLSGQNLGSTSFRLGGYGESLMDAFRAGWKAFRTEIPSDPKTRMELDNKRAIPSYIWDEGKFRRAGVGEGGIGGRQLRLPGRGLIGADEFAKLIHYRNELRVQTALRLQAENTENGISMSGRDFDKELRRRMGNPNKEDMLSAREMARKLTFTDDAGQVAGAIERITNAIPLGRTIVPFIRTPSNIVRYAADMVLWNTKRNKLAFEAGGFEADRAKARLLMGYSLIGASAFMAQAGLVTGASPLDPGERAVFEAEGKLPYSIKVGNQWVQWNRLDPVAIPFALGAGIPGILEAMNDPLREQGFMTATVGLMSEAFLNKTWFQGVTNVVEAITSPDRGFEPWAKGMVRTAVPSVVAGSGRALDPRVTAPQTLFEVIQDRLGFEARSKVPTKVDIFGRDVEVETAGFTPEDKGISGFIGRLANPFRAMSEDGDPVAEEFYELRMRVRPPAKKWRGVELTSEQYHAISKARGKQLYDGAKELISRPNWKNLSKEQKRLLLEEVKSDATETANIIFMGAYPEVYAQTLKGKINPQTKFLISPTRSELREMSIDPSIERGFGKEDESNP